MEFIKCKNLEELGQLCANEFKNIIVKKPNAILGLATGSSPIGVYQNLIKMYKNNEISFQQITTFNLDEYLGLKHEYEYNSYRNFMNENLFNAIDVNKNNTFFPCKTSDLLDSKKDYSDYDKEIANKGGLDLLILGIGSNGHIGFNEPGSSKNSTTRVVELTSSTIKDNSRFFNNNINDVPKYAVSMGLQTIYQAKKIVLIVVGESKKQAFEALKNHKEFNADWPCTVLANHPDTKIFYIEN